jgi:biopolymer transport protein ExbB/TolQ
MPLFVGTTIVGLVLAVAAYFITLEAVRDVRRLRARMHPAHESAAGTSRRTERTP